MRRTRLRDHSINRLIPNMLTLFALCAGLTSIKFALDANILMLSADPAEVEAAARKWELAVIGKNLTDKYTFSNARPIATSRGTYYVFPEPPRTISLAATVRF